MKRLLTFISILTFATAARAEFTSVALTSGDNPLLSLPARAVAIQVVSTVATNTVERILRREWTNTLFSTTLSGGIATNRLDALIFPGESIRASGTAFVGGKATLILER